MEESSILNKRSRAKRNLQPEQKKLKKEVPKDKTPKEHQKFCNKIKSLFPFRDEKGYNEFRKKLFQENPELEIEVKKHHVKVDKDKDEKEKADVVAYAVVSQFF